jgi:ubiquinone/menaquinone biosynthesis C-methylase UbiE
MVDANHQELILDQFTRQATGFSSAPSITDEGALQMIVEAARPGPEDTVLDVACGPGLVVCAFAPRVREATGVDVTPAMLERARALAGEKGLSNVSLRQGDVYSLPYNNGEFTIVTTRYSFHHFLDPAAVLREMVRVCAPGGRVVIVDDYSSEDPAKAAAFNRLERMRDPSHVRCLTLAELKNLFPAVGLPAPQTSFYELRSTVRSLLARSFPNPGDDVRIIEMFKASVTDDRLGIRLRVEAEEIHTAYPVAILAAQRPAQ